MGNTTINIWPGQKVTIASGKDLSALITVSFIAGLEGRICGSCMCC